MNGKACVFVTLTMHYIICCQVLLDNVYCVMEVCDIDMITCNDVVNNII